MVLVNVAPCFMFFFTSACICGSFSGGSFLFFNQKTGKLQCKKRKKTTTEEITPEHRYKASKTKPGNSGPTRD